MNRGLFTYILRQSKTGVRRPPPLCQQMSAFGWPPLVSFRQLLGSAPFVQQTLPKTFWNDNMGDIHLLGSNLHVIWRNMWTAPNRWKLFFLQRMCISCWLFSSKLQSLSVQTFSSKECVCCISCWSLSSASAMARRIALSSTRVPALLRCQSYFRDLFGALLMWCTHK